MLLRDDALQVGHPVKRSLPGLETCLPAWMCYGPLTRQTWLCSHYACRMRVKTRLPKILSTLSVVDADIKVKQQQLHSLDEQQQDLLADHRRTLSLHTCCRRTGQEHTPSAC